MQISGPQTYTFEERLKGPEKAVREVRASTVTGVSEVVTEGSQKLFDSKEGGAMGKDEFLTLLVTQLQYQDPMNPAEDSEFAAQLAQFSSLENSQNTADSMTKLATSLDEFMVQQTRSTAATSNASAVSLIGRNVRMRENEVRFDGVNPVEMTIHANEAKRVRLAITDAEGKTVKMVGLDNATRGEEDFTYKWEGGADEGGIAVPGTYNIEVLDDAGMRAMGYVFSEGAVEGLQYDSGGTLVSLGAKNFRLSDLVQVSE